MIWDSFTFSAHIREMERSPEKLIQYISQNLRSMSEVAMTMAGECGTEGFGAKPPPGLSGESLETALKIAAGEVMLSQLATHLGMACAAVLDNGRRPTEALKPLEDKMDESLYFEHFKILDEYGMVYKEYQKAKSGLSELIDNSQIVEKSGLGYGNPLKIIWNDNGYLSKASLSYVVASKAFEDARSTIIGMFVMNTSLIRGQ